MFLRSLSSPSRRAAYPYIRYPALARSRLTAFSLFVTVLFLLAGCAQRESDIGGNAVGNRPGVDFGTDSAFAVCAQVWHPLVSNGFGQSLQVGDTSFSAFFVTRFDPTTVLPDSYTVDSMVYVLRRNRVFPTQDAAPLTVRIRKVGESWREDSVFVSSFAGRDSFAVLGEMTFAAGPLDTLFRYPIPTHSWTEWIEAESLNYGLMFEPVSQGTLLEFYSAEAADSFQSQLYIYVVEHRDTTGGVTADTSYAIQLEATDDAYAGSDHMASLAPNRLMISQGVAQRGAILFPLDFLSANFERQIVRAQMILYADVSHGANFLYPSQNLSFRDGSMADSMWCALPDSAHLDQVAVNPTTFADSVAIAFDVSGLVASWVAHPGTNFGFQLQSATESNYLARQVFYGIGDDVPENRRPKIVVWWAEE